MCDVMVVVGMCTDCVRRCVIGGMCQGSRSAGANRVRLRAERGIDEGCRVVNDRAEGCTIEPG